MYGEVKAVRRLSADLLRVVFGGDGLADFAPSEWADSYVNAQFVPPGASYSVPFADDAVRDLPRAERPRPRRLTVRDWDPGQRLLSIDFVVHGDVGQAGRWALHARAGDRLQMRGPAGGYRPDPDADWHLLVGDESALPAIAVIAAQARGQGPVLVVAEVAGPADEIDLPGSGETVVHWVHRSAEPDHGGLLRAVSGLALPQGRGSAFVHGEAVATRSVRAHLLEQRRVAREDLSCSPYWRRGHTDEEWRSVKAAWAREVELDVPA